MLVVGHRGASHVAPENTLAAFTEAIESGADGYEFDIQELDDGNLVVVHDETMWRTCGARPWWWLTQPLTAWRALTPMRRSSTRWIQSLDVGSWFDERFAEERVPSFAAVAELTRTSHVRCRALAELKGTAGGTMAARAAEIARDVPPETMSWITYDLDLLVEVKRLDPSRPAIYVVNVHTADDAMAAARLCVDAGFDGLDVNADTNVVTKSLVDFLHDNDKQLYVYAYGAPASNDTPAIRSYMAALKVDLFTSNLPPGWRDGLSDDDVVPTA